MQKVTVITRTKDRPVFLKRAIRSVADQTYTDFVHVIVNDGGNKQQVEDVVAKFDDAVKKKIKLFHRSEASNAPDTIFNESIDRIGSKYFAIHDDDDTWHEEFLARTVEHLDENEELGAVVVRADKIIEEVRGSNIYQKKSAAWMPDMKVISLYNQCSFDNQLTPIATLYRRSAYEAVGKFDSSLPVIGDWEFTLRLLMKYDVDFVDPGFALANYHHRVEADNSFTKHNHLYYMNKVMNNYFREELTKGQLGIGYIISQNIYQQRYFSRLLHRVMPGFIVKRLKKGAES